MRVLREGLVLLDFAEWSETAKPTPSSAAFSVEALVAADERRLAVANAYLACLHTALVLGQRAVHWKDVVGIADVVQVTDISSRRVSFFSGTPRAAISTAAFNSRSPTVTALAEPGGHLRMLDIDSATLGQSFALLEALLVAGGVEYARLATLYLRSALAAEDEEFGLSVISGWALAERLLNGMSAGALPRSGLSSQQGHKLQRGPARKLIKFLEDEGLLSPQEAQHVHGVRRARNSWVHGLAPMSAADASSAVDLAGHLVRRQLGVTLELKPIPGHTAATP